MRKPACSLRAWPALALAIFFAVSIQPTASGQSCPVNFNTTGSIADPDATQSNRVTRNGVPSNCNGKAFPGLNDVTPQNRRFDQYTFTNTNLTPACIQVTFTGTISGLHSVAYLNSFDPANVQTNYVGDLGVIYAANTTASYSFTVPAGATFVVVVHETVAGGPANSYTLTVGCTTPPPPVPTAGQVIISEFRLSGPGASGMGSTKDEFIELYNNTDGPLSIGTFRLRAFDPNFFGTGDGADFVTTIPAGSIIPARGHFLVADVTAGVPADSYSLSTYAAPDFPLLFGSTQAEDFFIDNEGIEFITPSAAPLAVIDSIGFTGSGGRTGEVVVYGEGTLLPRRVQSPVPNVNYAYVRKMLTGTPQDTNNNAADFALVSVNGTSFTLAAGGSINSTLGAPGPENTTSPLQRNATIPFNLLDATVGGAATPNRVRSFTAVTNGTFGTMSIRRRMVNNTGQSVTRLRFRIVNITTFPSPGMGTADLRALTSGDTTAAMVNDPTTCAAESLSPPCTATVRGTTLEEPPAQANGGGLNSSLSVPAVTTAPITGNSRKAVKSAAAVKQASAVKPIAIAVTSDRKGVTSVPVVISNDVITLGVPLANGASINVQFLLGVQGTGTFRFFVNVEALP